MDVLVDFVADKMSLNIVSLSCLYLWLSHREQMITHREREKEKEKERERREGERMYM